MANIKNLVSTLIYQIMRSVVEVYTFLTLPFYTWLQNPSTVVKAASEKRALQIDPNDPHSPYYPVRWPTIKYGLLDSVDTFDELIEKLAMFENSKSKAIGQRTILRQDSVIDPTTNKPQVLNGVILKVNTLSDFNWLSYEEMVKKRKHIAFGLLANGFKHGDSIIFHSDTCLEFLLLQMAVAHVGGVHVNVATNTNTHNLIEIFKQTKAKFIFTTDNLLVKILSLLKDSDLDKITTIYTNRYQTPTIMDNIKESVIMGKTFKNLELVENEGKCAKQSNEEYVCKALPKEAIAMISK